MLRFKKTYHLTNYCCSFFLFFLGFIQVNYSQSVSNSSTDSLKIKYFTLEDGLSQVSSNDLLKDKSGFVWIATQDGLNRYDGNEFKHFKYVESDSTTLSGNLTNKLLEDAKVNIWVGTVGNGLNYYNPTLDVFHRIKLEHSNNENEIIAALAMDSEGSIWVASRVSGLHKLQYNDDGTFLQTHYLKNQPLSAVIWQEREFMGR